MLTIFPVDMFVVTGVRGIDWVVGSAKPGGALGGG
jgi:hypothetical protein